MLQLIGAWKLLFINTTVVTNSSVSSTLGKHPLGRILFTADGYMNAMVTGETQSKHLPSGITWGNANASTIATISRSMTAYSGPYRVVTEDNYTYTHVSVEVALNPDWIGTDQVRRANIEEVDGKLRLGLTPMTGKKASGNTLVWEKLDLQVL